MLNKLSKNYVLQQQQGDTLMRNLKDGILKHFGDRAQSVCPDEIIIKPKGGANGRQENK